MKLELRGCGGLSAEPLHQSVAFQRHRDLTTAIGETTYDDLVGDDDDSDNSY